MLIVPAIRAGVSGGRPSASEGGIALEAAGVVFIAENGGEAGVRLRKEVPA
jgi:hypothetical protein